MGSGIVEIESLVRRFPQVAEASGSGVIGGRRRTGVLMGWVMSEPTAEAECQPDGLTSTAAYAWIGIRIDKAEQRHEEDRSEQIDNDRSEEHSRRCADKQMQEVH